MIKRDKIQETYLLNKLSKEVPEFASLEEFDDLIYVDYDRFGTYISRLIEKFNKLEIEILSKAFNHLNSIFNLNDELILNILEVCIYESLVGFKLGYAIAKKYMSSEMYNHFMEKFPYEQYKNTWDTSNYYSEEEYEAILSLIDDNIDESE